MAKITPNLLPRVSRLLHGFGGNLKLARLRRKYSAETVAQRAGITRRTLSKVEQGDPTVAFGSYARVMQVLRLEDAGLTPKRRAPKKSSEKQPKDPFSPNEPTEGEAIPRFDTVKVCVALMVF